MILGTKTNAHLLVKPACYVKMCSAVNEAYLHLEPHLPCEAGEGVKGKNIQGVLAAPGKVGMSPEETI